MSSGGRVLGPGDVPVDHGNARRREAGVTLYKCPPDPYHYDAILRNPDRAAVVEFVEAFDERRKAPK